MPAWINPWGLVAFLLGSVALSLAPVRGARSLTIALAALGATLVVVGLAFSWRNRKRKDLVWLTLGEAVSGTVLLLALFAPGWLNGFWVLDLPIAPKDPNFLVTAPRDAPQAEGRPLPEGEWADGITQVFRQNDAVIGLQGVKEGPLADRGSASFTQVHLRVANTGYAQPLTIETFGPDVHQPRLTDDSGQSYSFLDQRPRRLGVGTLVFAPPSRETAQLYGPRYLEYLLVFQSPAPGWKVLNLELPASAWGRQGTCRFRISKCFEAVIPVVDKK